MKYRRIMKDQPDYKTGSLFTVPVKGKPVVAPKEEVKRRIESAAAKPEQWQKHWSVEYPPVTPQRIQDVIYKFLQNGVGDLTGKLLLKFGSGIKAVLSLPVTFSQWSQGDCPLCGAPRRWKTTKPVSLFAKRGIFINHEIPSDCRKYFDRRLSASRRLKDIMQEKLESEILDAESDGFVRCNLQSGEITQKAGQPDGLKIVVCQTERPAPTHSLHLQTKDVRRFIECLDQPLLDRWHPPDDCKLMGFAKFGDRFAQRTFSCAGVSNCPGVWFS